MNNTKILLVRAATIAGFALGAFALSAIAATVWQSPVGTAPANNVDKPINVGGDIQWKQGWLGLVDMFVTGSFTYASGTPADGMVLTSSTVGGVPGVAVWKTLDTTNCTTN